MSRVKHHHQRKIRTVGKPHPRRPLAVIIPGKPKQSTAPAPPAGQHHKGAKT